MHYFAGSLRKNVSSTFFVVIGVAPITHLSDAARWSTNNNTHGATFLGRAQTNFFLKMAIKGRLCRDFLELVSKIE